MLKRIIALGLSLILLMSLGACKPDNIQYPTIITDPNSQPETPEANPNPQPETNVPPAGEQEPPAAPETEENESPATDTPADQPAEGANEEAAETPAPNETGSETPAGEGETAETITTPEPEAEAAPETEGTQDVVEEPEVKPNPLFSADFKPSTNVQGTLPASGFIKNGSTAAALKNRTITFYTADETPAFAYLNEKGVAVNEWQWAEAIADAFGFQLKYTIKNKSISLKAQRTALFAGRKLSLVQMTDDQLALGMSLSRPADAYLNENAVSHGISSAVLEQTLKTLFAPVGNVNTLWYHPDLMPSGNDPATLSAQNAWTVEQFKAIYQNSANQGTKPLDMLQTLDWALLSGKSPLTLLDGKLDSNIYAQVTQKAFASLKAVNAELPAFLMDEDTTYSIENGTLAMAYTLAVPAVAEGAKIGYTSLPALENGSAATVSFGGTFFALPKYQQEEGADLAALTFAELWCNRYTETRAAALQKAGIAGADYEAYTQFAESKGQMIFRDPGIDALCETYLKGLNDPLVNMDDAYRAIKPQLMAKVAAYNLYY